MDDEWHVVRGLAQGVNDKILEPRRILLTGLAAVLAVSAVVAVLLLARAFRDRIPMLTSAAKAEVAALATRLRSDSPARSAPRVISSSDRGRLPLSRGRHVRVRERQSAEQPVPNPNFEAYLLVHGRRLLLRSASRIALLDLRTGRIEWMDADSDVSP